MSRPKKFNRSRAARTERRDIAKTNATERRKRTAQQQLDLLDKRLGKGAGAAKERSRLQSLIGHDKVQTKR